MSGLRDKRGQDLHPGTERSTPAPSILAAMRNGSLQLKVLLRAQTASPVPVPGQCCGLSAEVRKSQVGPARESRKTNHL